MAARWLKHCRQRHTVCGAREARSTLPYRSLDISVAGKPVLVLGKSRREPYVTLSYKWGSGKRITTTAANIKQFEQAIPELELPRTFRDAIQTAKSLGFSFIWIDALCIRQDLDTELRSQITSMAEIYANSALTIFAALGDHSDSGLGVPRNGPGTKPSRLNLCYQSNRISYSMTGLLTHNRPAFLLYNHGHHHM